MNWPNKKVIFIYLGILFFLFIFSNSIAYAYTDSDLDCANVASSQSDVKCKIKVGPFSYAGTITSMIVKLPRFLADNLKQQYNQVQNECKPDSLNTKKGGVLCEICYVTPKVLSYLKKNCLSGTITATKNDEAISIAKCYGAFGQENINFSSSFDGCDTLQNTTSLKIFTVEQISGVFKIQLTSEQILPDCKENCKGSYTVEWASTNPGVQCTLTGKMPNNYSSTEAKGKITFVDVARGIYTHLLKCTGVLDGKKSSAIGTIGPLGPIVVPSLMKTIKVGYIPPAPTVSLKVEPTEIKKGESAVLSWTSENAASVSINQGIGVVRSQGSIKVSPSFTTRYTITVNSEFTELGLKSASATLRVTAPRVVQPLEEPEEAEEPIEVLPEQPVKPEKPKLDLKINGQDGPLTMQAPADFKLSWNLDQYCIAYGSWFGVKTKAGEERHTEKKAGTYNYKLYCPGIGSDSVTVKVVGIDIEKAKTGVIAPEVPMPISEASISLDGKNFSKSIRVTRGEPVNIWLSAAHDVTGDKKASRDDTGRWTSNLSLGGRCEWNYDLNQGTPTFEAVTFDPQNPEECVIPLGELTFYDKAGVYRYGVLRLVQNDGKVSNISYVNIAVNEPPPPDTPPIIDLRINDLEGPMVTLGAPAEYIVSWKVRNADSCAASDAWKGDKFLAGSEKFVASSKRELTYTLTCIGKLGTTVKSINLKVAELPICDFSALPTILDKQSVFERQSVLSWKCQFANSCSINPEVGAGNETFGSIRVSPKATTEYILTCQNLEGSSSFSQTVEVR